MAFFGVAALIATADHLRLHALRAQHGAGGRLLAGRRGLAAGLVALLGFELDPFSILVPFLVFAIGVSHGAQKMNGIMQDIGRGTHQARRRALHVPPAVPRRPDRAARRRGRLRRADGDRHPGDPDLALTASIGVARADLHQPAAAAGAAVVHRRQRGGGRAQPARGARGNARQGPRQAVGVPRPLHRRAAGRSARSPWRRCSRSAASRSAASSRSATSIRARRSCARDSRYNRDNAYITAQLRAVLRPVRGDREDRRRTAASSTRRWSRPTAWPGRCGRCPGVQTTVSLADAVRQITAGSFEGNPKWLTLNRNQDVLNYAGAAGLGQQPGPLQHRVLGDAGDRLPRRPQGGDARPRRRGRRGVRRAAQRQGPRRSCSPPAAPASRRRPTSSSRKAEPHDAALRLRAR